MVAPHEQRLVTRATLRPSKVRDPEPVVMVTVPWIVHVAVSPTRAMALPSAEPDEEPVVTEPPCEIGSPTRATAKLAI
jgi:hypothetical protein